MISLLDVAERARTGLKLTDKDWGLTRARTPTAAYLRGEQKARHYLRDIGLLL